MNFTSEEGAASCMKNDGSTINGKLGSSLIVGLLSILNLPVSSNGEPSSQISSFVQLLKQPLEAGLFRPSHKVSDDPILPEK